MEQLREVLNEFNSTLDTLPGGPKFLGALVLIFFGWILCKLITAGVFRALKRVDSKGKLSENLFPTRDEERESRDRERFARVTSRVVFWVLMLFVIIGVFDVLDLESASEPLREALGGISLAVPGVLKALAIAGVAWLVAGLLRSAVRRGLEKVELDKQIARISGEEDESEAEKQSKEYARTSGRVASEIVFYFVLFLAVPPVLTALGLDDLGLPFRNVIDEMVLVIPDAVSALALFFGGWLGARLARSAVSNVLHSVGVDDWSEKIGYDKVFKDSRLSALIGAVAFWLIMIPVSIAAIETLGLDALTNPMRVVLVEVWGMVPNLFGAVVILVASLVGAKLVGGLIETLAETLGANSLLPRLGLGDLDARMKGKRTMSEVLGQVAAAIVLLFGVAEAMFALELEAIGGLVTRLLNYLPEAGVAVAIVALGLFVGDFVRKLVEEQVKNEEDAYLGRLAKIGIIAVAAVAASEEAGIASDFTLVAFTTALAATGLALALAFGLGSRDTAGDFVRRQVERRRRERRESITPPMGGGGGGGGGTPPPVGGGTPEPFSDI